MSAPDGYTTLAAPLRFEGERVKNSRFVCDVAPIRDEEQGAAVVAAARLAFPDADHHCWAWRLGPGGERYRSSDDGEPGGSAGRPILAQLEAKGVTDACAVVTRWFGGTKLGVGGLVRAYAGATARALDRASLKLVVPTRNLTIEHGYDLEVAVDVALREEGLTALEAAYGETVRRRVAVPLARIEPFLERLRDGTHGRARVEREPDGSGADA